MRKAVTLVKRFLKLQRSKKSDLKDNEDEESKRNEPALPDITISRPCRRCILAYEDKIRKPLQTRVAQEDAELTCGNNDEKHERRNNPRADKQKIRSLLQFYGLGDHKGRENSLCSDKSCMSLRCLQGHILWNENSDYDIDSHFPTFVLVRETNCWQPPMFHEDSGLILLRIGLGALRSLLSIDLQTSQFHSSGNIEVWIVITKLRHQAAILKAEDLLGLEALDNFVLIAFLNIPLSQDQRTEHLEALFQAVDNIMDISIYLLASGDSSEIQSSVKDAIIETATMVTSTAAESTATVGIETAAMAMGQAAAGVALSVLVDVAITAGTVTRAKIKRDKGLISQSEFKTTVRHKLCDSGCQFIGGTTGTIVGQVLIPVPVVGAIVGGICGSLIGTGVSKGIIKTTEIISRAQASKAKAITDK